jgi:hypothetical protein
MSKATQYVANDDEVASGLVSNSLKFAQASFQVCIIWPKKLGT